MLDKIDEYRRIWLLHLQRLLLNRIPLKSHLYRPQGRRTIGRPKKGKPRKDGARPALFLFVVLLHVFLCCSMYCLFCDALCIVCVYMCIEQLPPGSYQIAVKHIISYHIISYHIISYHIISYQTLARAVVTLEMEQIKRCNSWCLWWWWWWWWWCQLLGLCCNDCTWMKYEYGALVKHQWQGRDKVRVLRDQIVPLSLCTSHMLVWDKTLASTMRAQ
jgi:hypothetical protein